VTTSAPFVGAALPGPTELLRRAWANRPLTILGSLMLALFGATLLGIALDPRIITGVPAWVKPSKFAISLSIYSFTVLWLLTFVQGRPRLVATVSWATLITSLIEIVIIVGQAVRGTTSHFNIATPLDAALFNTMAAAIVTLWLAGLLLAVLLLRQRLPHPALAWGLRLGMLVALVGMALAFLMTARPTPAQQAALAAGQAVPAMGAHSVGVEDGGPGLPYFGWSTQGGDLRVAHFVGLHAMQVVPFVGWLVAAGLPRLSRRRQVALVLNAGLSYLTLTLLLAWQALRGQPLIAPDSVTLAALGALLAASALAAALTLWRPHR
jgi:hypothetical protein